MTDKPDIAALVARLRLAPSDLLRHQPSAVCELIVQAADALEKSEAERVRLQNEIDEYVADNL